MQADWAFWIAATALALVAFGAVLAPLIRLAPRAERRASYDMQVYRDQLREIDADVARGVLGADEAAAVRVEISRRLLGAADAEAAETAAAGAPPVLSRGAAAALGVVLALGAGGLYATLGARGRPDLPLSPRLAQLAAERANRPSQAEAEAAAAEAPPEAPAIAPAAPAGAPPPTAPAGAPPPTDLALVERLRAVVAARPDDAEGHRLLARSEAALDRWPQARVAQARLLELLGPAATPDDRVDLAEFMILATGGYVSPEAEASLSAALEAAPGNPVARYYSGLALLQGGRPDLTLQLWSRLLDEGPPDAPWITPIAAQIDSVAMLAGQPPPAAPSSAEVAAAEGAAAADTAAMISEMVARLSDRLAEEGGPPEDWARLIRSLGVLDRVDEAEAIFRESRAVFAADPDALELLQSAAAEAGIAG